MPQSKRKMHIKKMDHSALIVRDLERSRAFYGEVLGLVEVPRPKSFVFRGAWFRGPSFELHLILADDTTAPVGFGDPGEGGLTGLAHHLAFEVDDLDEALAYLRRHNVEILSGPMPRGDGVVQAYVFDPDGNFLEFFCWDGDETSLAEERYSVGQQHEVR
ncbi:MAG TPA: VOC family protein [Ktedonobacterales bacterium]